MKMKKYYKRYSNKKIRLRKKELLSKNLVKGGHYKKVFDLMWTLY